MNLSDVIEAHRSWKTRFRVAMGTREPLDVERIASDRHCELGAWLHAENGAASRLDPDARRQCVECHIEFHRRAGAIAEAVNEGRLMDAERMLAAETPYADASRKLAVALTALVRLMPAGSASHSLDR